MSRLSLARDKIYKTIARQMHGVVTCRWLRMRRGKWRGVLPCALTQTTDQAPFKARRYCTASATWPASTCAAPARSAMVRATFKQR